MTDGGLIGGVIPVPPFPPLTMADVLFDVCVTCITAGVEPIGDLTVNYSTPPIVNGQRLTIEGREQPDVIAWMLDRHRA